MFCTKCGFNAGDSKFCPKCGAPLGQNKSATTENTPVTEEVTNTPVSENATNVEANTFNDGFNQNANTSTTEANNGFTQPQAFGQPQTFGQPQAFGQQPNGGFDQAQYGAVNQAPKAKKKWPKVVAIVVAVVAALAVIGYFAYPFIYSLVSPKAKAETALKNLGKNVDSYVDEVLENGLTSTDTQVANETSVTLKALELNDEDYLEYLNAKTVKWDIQSDVENGEMSGDIAIVDEDGDEVVTIEMYSDGSYVYFSCPELFEESFKIDVDSVYSSYSSYSAMLGSLSSSGSLDLEQVEQYSDEIKAVVGDVLKGYNVFVENLEYKKVDNKTFKSENGNIKVTEYEVTVNKDALVKGFNAAVDALYSDKEISSYMSLLTTFSGSSKDSIKSSFESELSSFSPVSFNMYVNNEKEIVRLSVTGEGNDGEIFAEFIGKKDPTDYIHVGFNYESDVIDLVVKEDGDSYDINLKAQGEDLDLTIASKFTKDGDKKVTLDNFSIVGTADDESFDIELSGQSEIKDYSGLKYKKSDFSGASNIEYLTSSEEQTLALEVLSNIDVLKKVVSEDLIDELFGSAISTSTNSSYTGTYTAADYGISLQINADGSGVLTSDGSSIDVDVTISDGTIVVANAYDSTDYISYSVTFTDTTMTWTDSTGSSIVFTKGV